MGNTNAAWGLFDGGALVRSGRVPLAELASLPEHIGPAGIKSAALASVVPSRNVEVVSGIEKAYGVRPRIAGKDLPVAVEVRCDDPSKVGVDRLLNAVAAYARTKRATVVVDIGTAVTVNAVAANGAFLGGAIAPGPETMLHALNARTESLPKIGLGRPSKATGTNTGDAMRSGAYWGTVGMIQSLVRRIAKELGGDPPVLLTGGGAEAFKDDLGLKAEYVPFLTLEGLNALA
jgi:type III pantothenate kinase